MLFTTKQQATDQEINFLIEEMGKLGIDVTYTDVLAGNAHSLYLTNDSTIPVASAVVEAYGEFSSDSVWLSYFAVKDTARNNGYGTQLINFLKLKYSMIYLAVLIDNWPARKFWTKHNFKRKFSHTYAHNGKHCLVCGWNKNEI